MDYNFVRQSTLAQPQSQFLLVLLGSMPLQLVVAVVQTVVVYQEVAQVELLGAGLLPIVLA
jgi:hypothetical protein